MTPRMRMPLLAKMQARLTRLERQRLPPPPPPASIGRILDVVAEAYGLTRNDLVGQGRTRQVTEPRQLAMSLARSLTPHSLASIGHAIGRRDHTTVLHGIRATTKRALEDQDFAARISTLATTIKERTNA